jgi:hypothetical protein
MTKHIIILFLFISYLGSSQTPSFVAQVSKNKVAIGEVFQVAFTLNGSGSKLTYPNGIRKKPIRLVIYLDPTKAEQMIFRN